MYNKVMKIPAYNEIPEVGLYLEQVIKYLNMYLEGEATITPTMVTNYVKLKIVPKAVKKAYSREQIAMFFFIAISKSILSMDQIRKVFTLRTDAEKLYRTFSEGLEGKKTDDVLLDSIAASIRYKADLDRLIKSL